MCLTNAWRNTWVKQLSLTLCDCRWPSSMQKCPVMFTQPPKASLVPALLSCLPSTWQVKGDVCEPPRPKRQLNMSRSFWGGEEFLFASVLQLSTGPPLTRGLTGSWVKKEIRLFTSYSVHNLDTWEAKARNTSTAGPYHTESSVLPDFSK